MAISMKERYLSNPHITLDDKRKRQLGITTEDIDSSDVALDLPSLEPITNKEVVVRKKHGRTENSDTTASPLDRDTVLESNPESI